MLNNSVNTNAGALIGQRFLRANSNEIVGVQNRVSSGLRVNSVTDDASTYAVAAGLRADIKSYTAISASLQAAKVLGTVAVQAGETVSKRLEDIKAKIVQLADESLSSASRSTYGADLASMVTEVNNYLRDGALYNGSNLLGTGSASANVLVVANIDASAFTLRAQNVSDLAVTAIASASEAQSRLADLATFKSSLDTGLANLGADLKRLDSQVEFIKQTEETVRIGLGALVDADMAKETAELQSLQVRQQLGVQAMGIANQAPQTLVSLLRG
jgi:flagellin